MPAKTIRAGLHPELKAQLLDLLARGGRLTLADVASAVPKDIGLAEAIRLFQRWGWDLLAERAAGRVRYYPQQQRAIASVGTRLRSATAFGMARL